MAEPAILVLRAAREEYALWLARLQNAPDPLAVLPETVRRLSPLVRQAGIALKQRPLEDLADEEWREEVRRYREALRELHQKLEHLGTGLRVRRVQLAGTRAHQQAVRSWAELTRKLR